MSADFSLRLRELRVARALRQKDLAAALGLAQTTIANYEQKLRFPDEPTLVRIADYFTVSLDQLMGRGDGAGPGTPLTAAAEGPRAQDATRAAGVEPLSGEAREYFQLLRGGAMEGARALLLHLVETGAGTADLYLRVITPALHEVGRLWAAGEMSVADEHWCSEATQQIMASLLPRAPAPSSPRARCVVLPVSGDYHLIGARMVADLLSLAGYDVRFLGARLSIGHVRESLLADPPDLVAFSVTLPDLVNAAADTIRSLRGKRALARTRVLVGGQAIEGAPTLWRQIGADAQAADAEEAVRTAGRLIGGSPEGR